MLEAAVKQFFFLHYPTRRQVDDNKYVYRTRAEDRKEIIERMGVDAFISCGQFTELYEPEVPRFFLFLYKFFLDIYREELSWTEIESYCRLRDIVLTQYELDVVIKMFGWASEQIKAMRDEDGTE